MARTRTAQAVVLLDGQALVDYCAPEDYNYYIAQMPADADALAHALRQVFILEAFDQCCLFG